MTVFSLARALSVGAAAVGLLAAGAAAQGPLVPASVTHRHSPIAPLSPNTAVSAVKSGPSFVSVPRYGSSATRGPLVPRIGGAVSSSIVAFGWLSDGPDVLHNNSGAVDAARQDASGRVAGIAVDPTDSNTFYSASAGGGVWKTTNGGASYIPLTDFLGDTAMGSIAVAPSNHNVVYAGTGEANFSADCKYGIGLLKSTNGGTTWSLITGPAGVFDRQAISRIVISPTDPSTVFITTTYASNGFGGEGDVWKTTDGGANWTSTLASTNTTGQPVTDLVMNPTTPDTLYAAIGNIFGNGSNGIYKTTDGGTNWGLLGGGLPSNPGRISLALAASNPNVVYASIANTIGNGAGLQGLYVTTDGGTTWTQKTAAPNYLGGQGWYDNAIVVSPTDPNVVFAGGQVNYSGSHGTLFALAGSQDGGKTFQDYSIGSGLKGPHTDLHALTFTPDGTKLMDGNDGGVWRLENPYSNPGAGSSIDLSVCNWTDLNSNLDTVQFTGIALHPTDSNIAYGGSQDNGTEMTSGSLGWDTLRGGDGGFVRLNQTNPQIVYHEYYGISLEVSSDGGINWSGGTGINPNDPVGPDGSDQRAFYVPYKLDPANQSRVIYGTDHVYESLDNGGTFTAIGTPGTAGFNPSGSAASTLGVYGSTIYVSAGGSLFATYNSGGNWADVSIPGITESFSDVYVNPTNPKDVYVSRPSFFGGKVFRSTSGGAAWSDITSNLPDEPFNAVLLDKKSGVLYAGGDDGVYSSTSYGGSWSKLSTGLPTVQVANLDLVNATGIIAAGTHGRGMWRLPLSSVTAKPNLIVNAVVSRISSSTVTVTITLKNTGTSGSPAGTGLADALNTVITSVKLNSVAATMTPKNIGVVPAYGSVSGLTFTVSNSTSGLGGLQVKGTYGGGNQFGGSLRLAVP